MIYENENTIFNNTEQYQQKRIVIDGENKQIKGDHHDFNVKLSKYLKQTGLGIILDIIDVILSALMPVLYILHTYTDNHESTKDSRIEIS